MVVGHGPSVGSASSDARVAYPFRRGAVLKPDKAHVPENSNIAPHVDDLIERLQRCDLDLVVAGRAGCANNVQPIEVP